MTKNRKPRTKEQIPFFVTKKCWYFDGYTSDGYVMTECHMPWRDRCDGNQHNCKHFKMKYLASLSEQERKKFLEKYG